MIKVEALLLDKIDLIDPSLPPDNENLPEEVLMAVCETPIVLFEGRLIKNRFGSISGGDA